MANDTAPEPLTDADLDAIEARAQESTDGPWFMGTASIHSKPLQEAWRRWDANTPVDMPDGDPRWWNEPDDTVATMPILAGDTPTRQGFLDGCFVAAARSDIPRLVAALRAEREENRRLRDVAEAARKVRLHHPYCESRAIGDHPCDCDSGAIMHALVRLDGDA